MGIHSIPIIHRWKLGAEPSHRFYHAGRVTQQAPTTMIRRFLGSRAGLRLSIYKGFNMHIFTLSCTPTERHGLAHPKLVNITWGLRGRTKQGCTNHDLITRSPAPEMR